MRAGSAVLVAAMAMCIGCGDTGDEQLEQLGFVLLDLQAQEAGWQLEGLGPDARLLPASLDEGEAFTLRGPQGAEVIEARRGELLYVRGAEGAAERYLLGDEVSRDSLFVIGTREAAEALARRSDADVEAIDEGVYRLEGPSALLRLSDGQAPGGLQELLPAETLDELPELELRDGQDARVRAAAAEVDGRFIVAAAGARPQLDFASAGALPIAKLMQRSVSCADPVEGLWVTRRYDARHVDWHLFTLEVRRDATFPSTLTGRIGVRSWAGDAEQNQPSSCDAMPLAWPGQPFELSGEMRAEGSFDGRHLSFRGTRWQETGTRCAQGSNWYTYHLDHFTGDVGEDGRNIDAVNNDGARSFDEPHAMRRVGCL